MKLIVKLTNGVKFSTEFSGSTVLECKQHLHSEHSCAVPSQQRIVYKGRIMDDDKQLESDYQITDGSILFLVTMKDKKAAPKPPAAPSAATPATTAATATTIPATQTSTVPSAPAAGIPNLNDLMQQMSQMQPTGQNEAQAQNSAQDPLQNPLLQSMMNENPEMITNILQSQLESNPALRELMDSNPMVREVLQDPAALRNMMQAAAHPDVRAQQQRHHDLALANIENMPGGFNLLRSMYENVQAPLEEAASSGGGGGGTATNSTTNPNNSSAGASGQAMPNPWGSNTSNRRTNPATPQANQNPLLAGLGGGANPFMAGGANPFGTGAMDPNSPENRDDAINMLERNPQIQQMMQQFAAQEPGMIRQLMAASNPAAAQMLQGMSDEQLGSMMQMALQPNVLRMMQGQGGGGGGAGAPPMPPFMNSMNPAMLQGLLGSPAAGAVNPFGASGASNPWATGPANPADRYRSMLEQMRAMGFDNDDRSLIALQRANGNLNRAVDLLLDGSIPEATQSDSPGSGDDKQAGEKDSGS